MYYNDGRDVLEKAYPSSTSFARYHSHPTLIGLQRRQCGVALVLDLRSTVALDHYKLACYELECSKPWDRFSFDIYDFDGIAEVLPVLSPFGVVIGAGEAFGVSHGRVIAAVMKYENKPFNDLTEALLRA